jgi:hypothetical protein
MREHWDCASRVVQALAMKIGPLDENGLDLLFTIGCDNYKRENVMGFNIQSDFKAAMMEAKAPNDPNMYQTAMAKELGSIFSQYRKDMSRMLTIIVLTTGLWEGQPNDVEEVVVEAVKAMCAVRSDFQIERWCTIEFVSFGDDEEALQRLKDLDDRMKDRYGIP